jgi:hypothetical protein
MRPDDFSGSIRRLERMITMRGASDHHQLEFVITIVWND